MFLSKKQRWVRRYNLTFKARHALGVALPLVDLPPQPSFHHAMLEAIDQGRAEVKQANGDALSLVKLSAGPAGVLTLLFHRDSFDAADPTYRRIKDGKRTLRFGEKDDDEEQTVSAHMVIAAIPEKQYQYKFVLEEIPGLSVSSVFEILRTVLSDYHYDYTDKKGDVRQTYTSLKYEGEKSAKLEEALKKGVLDIRLSRPAKVDFLDSEGLIEPGRETSVLKVKAQLEPEEYFEKLKFWKGKAHDEGWTDFSVDLELDDKRRKTVKIERDEEAKQVLFVRSEQLNFDTEMLVCSPDIIPEFVAKSIELMKT